MPQSGLILKLEFPKLALVRFFKYYERNFILTASDNYVLLCNYIFKPVKSFLLQNGSNTAVSGVLLEDGREFNADVVLSNATPKITFLDLLPKV